MCAANEHEDFARLSVDLPKSLNDRLVKTCGAIGSDRSEFTRAAIEIYLQVVTNPLLSVAILKVQTRSHHMRNAGEAHVGLEDV